MITSIGEDDIEIISKIKTYHKEALNLLLEKKPYLTFLKDINVKVNLNKTSRSCIGSANVQSLKISLHYRLLLRHPEELKPTYIHELAHIFAHLIYGSNIKDHGDEWKELMEDMGEKPTVTHNLDVSEYKRKHKKKKAYCLCSIHKCSQKKYKEILHGEVYRCLKCHKVLMTHRYDEKLFS